MLADIALCLKRCLDYKASAVLIAKGYVTRHAYATEATDRDILHHRTCCIHHRKLQPLIWGKTTSHKLAASHCSSDRPRLVYHGAQVSLNRRMSTSFISKHSVEGICSAARLRSCSSSGACLLLADGDTTSGCLLEAIPLPKEE